MHTVDQRNDRHSCCKWFTCSAGFICAPTSSGACRRFLGLANLTEAVNKGCCWLDQTASTFWGKGWLLSNMDGDGVIGKQRVAAWNPWTCRSAVFEWFWSFGGRATAHMELHSDGFLLKMWCCLGTRDLICLLLPVWCLCSQRECVFGLYFFTRFIENIVNVYMSQ